MSRRLDKDEKDEELTHLDLFSGIGGFALAAGWAGFKTVQFVEIDPFCQGVLKKHWPRVPIWDDIKTFNGERHRGVGLLTGGFPCQPFSIAGKRRGKEDDRFLWPKMLNVIEESRPHWVLGENVAGFIKLGLKDAVADLESISFECHVFSISSCSIKAPHGRQRIWIVGRNKENQDNPIPDPKGAMLSETTERQDREERTPVINGVLVSEQSGRSDWWGVEPGMGRVANGIPRRVDRLRAIGNAIVPQVAYQIIKAIAEIERGKE